MKMSAVSTFTRFRVGGLEPPCIPFTELRGDKWTIFQRLQFSGTDRWDSIPTMLISMSDTPCRDYVHFLEGVERSCLYLRLLPPLSTAHFLSARAVQDSFTQFNEFLLLSSLRKRLVWLLSLSLIFSRPSEWRYLHRGSLTRRAFPITDSISQQPFTAYRAADVPVIWVVAKPITWIEQVTYGVQIRYSTTELYRLSRGNSVPLYFPSVTVLFATVFWIASEKHFCRDSATKTLQNHPEHLKPL